MLLSRYENNKSMEPNWTRRKLLGAAGTGVGFGALLSSDSISRMLTQQAQATAVESGDWPQFGFDAANTSYNPGTRGPEGDAEVDWTYEPSVEGPIKPPVVASGSVYTTAGEQIVALDEADGSEQWVYDELSSPTPPAVVDIQDSETDLVCVGHRDGVVALNASSGDSVWEAQTTVRVSGAPTVSGQTLYVSDNSGSTYEIDGTTGEITWQIVEGGGGTNVVGEESIWSQAFGQIGVIFLDRAADEFEGTEWRDNATLLEQVDQKFSLLYQNVYLQDHAVPLIANGTVYVPSLGLQAIDIQSGSEKWHFDDDIVVPGSPTIVDDRVIFGSGTELEGIEDIDGAKENAGTLYAINKEDSTVEWTFDANGPINTSPAGTVRTVYATSDDGTVYAFSVFTGDVAWSYEVGDGVGDPVVANNRLFVGTEENGLVALVEPENTETPTQTPTESQSDDNGGDETDSSDDSDDNNGDDDSDGNPAGNESDGSGDDGGGSDGFAPGLGIGSALAGLGGASYLLKRRFENDDQS
jgi:outer membrane protein assembly factor BamB